MAQIYGLIAQAMRKVGAIGKDSINQQQKYKFRGIDAVYNALNPVMSELGLFICPEIIDHRREERQNQNGTILKYSVLTIKYTMYAPDGSNVSCTVVGEGMDSGDKASNKAMSVALKYACFQLFMIPTEEMVDPDQESHEVTSGAKEPNAPKETRQERIGTPNNPPVNANVTNVPSVPQTAQNDPQKGENPVLDFISNERESLRVERKMTKAENNALFKAQADVLRNAGLIPNKAFNQMTMNEAKTMVNLMYTKFTPTGTELLPDDGQTA